MQQVVEVVRDAAGEPADRLHLLRLAQLLLGLAQRLLGALALGDVGDEHEPDVAARVVEVVRLDLDEDDAAVALLVAPQPARGDAIRGGDVILQRRRDPPAAGCRRSSSRASRRACSRSARAPHR